jgi:hypothetical protein
MSLFGVSTQTAASFTLANHPAQVFPVSLMGFLSAALISVNIRQVAYTRDSD